MNLTEVYAGLRDYEKPHTEAFLSKLKFYPITPAGRSCARRRSRSPRGAAKPAKLVHSLTGANKQISEPQYLYARILFKKHLKDDESRDPGLVSRTRC